MSQGSSRRVHAVVASSLTAVLATTPLAFASASTPANLAVSNGSSLSPVRAVAADSVADTFGVCVHVGFLDTPYRDASVVRDAVADLGVRHVRDELTLDTPWQYAAMRTVAQAGARFDLITGNPTQAAPSAYVDTVATQLPGVVESLEGTNEWDISGRPGWVAELRARQQALYAAAKGNPATASLPVLAPSLAFPWNWDAAGDFGSMADLGNGHLYAGGRMPSYALDSSIPHLASLVDGKPVVVTEAGYHNATASTATNADGHPMVPEDVSAAYLPRMFLDDYLQGARRTYDYELIDEFDDSSMTNPEAHFGLLRHDLTPKPAYTALKNLLHLLDDPAPAGAVSFTPGDLAYRLTGDDGSLRQLLVQRRDRHFVLLLWREVSIWNPDTHTRTSVAPLRLTLGLATPAQVRVLSPDLQASPLTHAASTSAVSLSVGSQVTAIDIGPVVAVKRPTSVSAVAGRRTVTVSWRRPVGQSGVTAMRVYRSPGRVTTNLPARATSLRVSGLARHTRYRFSVRTVTGASSSSWAVAPAVVPR